MLRKSVNSFLFISILMIAGCVGVLAQLAPVSGSVELEKADGTREPVPGALIEVYRTDIRAGAPSGKTNRKGEFNFAGMLLTGKYAFAISAPGCAPLIWPNPRPGQDKLVITLSPGDGSKLTEEQVRKGLALSAANPASGEKVELTAEQKKAIAEFEAEKAKVIEKNTKAEKTNQIVSRTLKEGNDAYKAANYDLAISKYEEGIAADPDFVGSAPTFLNNRGVALRMRAVETYNRSVKMTDTTERIATLGKVKKDFADASEGYLKSWTIMKNAAAEDITDKNRFEQEKMSALRGSKETFEKAVKTEQVDQATIDAAKILIPEYLALETDAARKFEASLAFADLYRVIGESENAIAAYKLILATSPDNQDALAGAGLSLVNLGYINNDKAQMQEGANLLQKFASVAPDTHKYKADAIGLIETLKKDQNVTPQKVTTPKKRP